MDKKEMKETIEEMVKKGRKLGVEIGSGEQADFAYLEYHDGHFIYRFKDDIEILTLEEVQEILKSKCFYQTKGCVSCDLDKYGQCIY